jgi:F-type H+-transporting ATPase subunit delta
MDTNRVTVRYARALIDLAIEQENLEELDRDIRVLFSALQHYPDFFAYIINPGNSSKDKYLRISTIFSDDFHPLSINFLHLVFNKKREYFLKEICRNFIDMAKRKRGIITAHLDFAFQPDDQSIIRIKEKFESRMNTKIEMSSDTKPELIGGFIFTIDGQQYDASIASRINKIKKQLQLKE